jgi:hypothetical protein
MKVAAISKKDERLIWAVHRATQLVDSRYHYWLTVDCLAAELKITNLPRNERLLLLRAWQLLAWNQGTFGRLWSGYGAMYSSLCDQDLDFLDVNQKITRASEDAELLPVMIEAYEEARTNLSVSVTSWIPCSDEDQMVAVFDRGGEGVLIAWRSFWKTFGQKNTGKWEWTFQNGDIDDANITHWMPLPANPSTSAEDCDHG